MKKTVLIFTAIALLGACSNVTKKSLGLTNSAPNEFMVEPRAPLSLPPEYHLRPVKEPVVEPVNEDNAELSKGEQALVEAVNE